MSDEEAQYEDETGETVDEWREEAGKWKQRAAEAERAAAETAGAVERLAQIEKSTRDKADEYAAQVEAVKAEAEQATKEAEERGAKTADEWRSEAEKWKELARKNEQLAKQNLAAVKRLEKLEADRAEAEKRAAETKADIEAKATAAERKAMRLAVAQELGVPTTLVDLLSGSSKREIEQSADRLLRELAANKAPEPAVEAVKAQQEKAKEDSELAEARKALAEAEVKALRLEVATEKQLSSGLAELLNANTREDLERQADALLAAIGGARPVEKSTRARMPTERLRSGALPTGAIEPEIDPAAIAERILRSNRGY